MVSKKDLLNLGFLPKENRLYDTWEYYKEKGVYSLQIDNKDNIVIAKLDAVTFPEIYVGSSYMTILFQGKLKNKTELEKLMRQIGILNE